MHGVIGRRPQHGSVSFWQIVFAAVFGAAATFDSLVSAGFATSVTHAATAACGPRFVYTSTRAGFLRFDNISIAQAQLSNAPPAFVGPP